MGEAEVEKIRTIFKHLGIEAEFIEHAEVRTSEEAAAIRDGKLEQGVKAMLVKEKISGAGKGTESGAGGAPIVVAYAIVDVPANLKIHFGKVSRFLGWKDAELASPLEVQEQTGCELGGVPPLAHKNKLRIIADNRIFNNKYNEFNCGLRTASVRLRSTDFRSVLDKLGVAFGDFSK